MPSVRKCDKFHPLRRHSTLWSDTLPTTPWKKWTGEWILGTWVLYLSQKCTIKCNKPSYYLQLNKRFSSIFLWVSFNPTLVIFGVWYLRKSPKWCKRNTCIILVSPRVPGMVYKPTCKSRANLGFEPTAISLNSHTLPPPTSITHPKPWASLEYLMRLCRFFLWPPVCQKG